MHNSWKKLLFGFFVCVVLAIGVGWPWLSARYTVPIMMYHQVEEVSKYQPNWVSPKNFEYHMRFLKENGYNVLRLSQLVELIQKNKPFPAKSVVITFDDGYENNYTAAFSVLKKYNFPAIIFLPSDEIDTPGFLTSPQIKEMISSGIDMGGHTRTQEYLPDLPPNEQWNQIKESKRILEEKLSTPIDFIAYPIGGFSEDIKKMVKDSGYKAAVATNRGYDRFNRDLYELKRIRFSDHDNDDMILRVKLSGFYNLFRKQKKPF